VIAFKSSSSAGLALVLAVACAAFACGDPVHDDDVDALGPEADGVPKGPTHRAGQPCLVCHGGDGPGGTTFSAAGTIYQVKGQTDPLVQATVHLTDAKGATFDATTNEVGNFFVNASDFAPVFPLHAEIEFQNDEAPMTTHIGRDASCSSCHYDPPGPTTPGRVYLVEDPSDLPGASP
jgi:hypothetical protein